eukprot:767439-Hanusia_phi.AAC.1
MLKIKAQRSFCNRLQRVMLCSSKSIALRAWRKAVDDAREERRLQCLRCVACPGKLKDSASEISLTRTFFHVWYMQGSSALVAHRLQSSFSRSHQVKVLTRLFWRWASSIGDVRGENHYLYSTFFFASRANELRCKMSAWSAWRHKSESARKQRDDVERENVCPNEMMGGGCRSWAPKSLFEVAEQKRSQAAGGKTSCRSSPISDRVRCQGDQVLKEEVKVLQSSVKQCAEEIERQQRIIAETEVAMVQRNERFEQYCNRIIAQNKQLTDQVTEIKKVFFQNSSVSFPPPAPSPLFSRVAPPLLTSLFLPPSFFSSSPRSCDLRLQELREKDDVIDQLRQESDKLYVTQPFSSSSSTIHSEI